MLKDAPGNYIYAKETSPGTWRPLYIGQTGSLRKRLASHEKEISATRWGATHIHVHLSSQDDDVRQLEEADLIARFNPPLNVQEAGCLAGGLSLAADASASSDRPGLPDP